MSALLQVRDAAKHFGGLRAVDDISFEVGAGEIVSLIGPNGAGKTTLFNLLCGVVRPDAGTVTLGGREITGLAANQVARAGIGRTFQVVRAFPRLSVRENVVVGAFARHGQDRDAWAAADAAVERVGLTQYRDMPAASLTNRELRLMELARALAGAPRLLLLDEPLAGLGAEDAAELIDVLRRLPELGVTVAIIEHTIPAMLGLVDRFVVLDQGQKLEDGAPEAVMRSRAVIEAYLGRGWEAGNAAA